jgi:hypothetical protein
LYRAYVWGTMGGVHALSCDNLHPKQGRIIGCGVAGITLALRLADVGVPVTVVTQAANDEIVPPLAVPRPWHAAPRGISVTHAVPPVQAPHCRATPPLCAGAAAIGSGWLERRGEKRLYISYSPEPVQPAMTEFSFE